MIAAIIILVLFLALLWAIVLFFQLPLWIALSVTAVVVVGVALYFVLRRIKAGAAAREIENSLGKSADAQAESARPDQQAEIEAMRAEFQKAVQSLKSSKLARGGRDALAVLPWYMIIGPPGAGKSTALRASGLKFPYLSARGGGVKGVGGTRNCEWWLTNEAVILDTAGRYATEEEDRDEWFSFLDTLARARKSKPINGLIVGVSVSDLGGETEEGVIELAKRLRERVDEVMARLHAVLPTYLLFTKCDLIPGFVETFSDLRKSERGQVWGFTVPLDTESKERGEIFRERFEELSACIEERSLQRLGDERQTVSRERIFGFPQQFEALRQNLQTLVEHLFAENVYQDTPVMRGVYFTSGTQEGRTIDRVMSAMADAFGIRPAATSTEPVLEAKSYFLRDVFAKVIFPDKALAVLNAKALRRRALQRYALTAACGVAALVVLFFPLYAFFQNRVLLRSTSEIVSGVTTQLASADKTGVPPLDKLEPLRARLDELVRYQDESPPFMMRFGMYQGNELIPNLRKLFAASTRRLILDPVFRQDVADMDAFARRLEGADVAPSLSDHARYYDRLKLHLLLTAPRGLHEPKIGPAEQAWLAKQVAERWSGRWSTASDPVAPQVIEADTALFARLLAEEPTLALPRYEDVVRRLRRVLQKLPLSSLALGKLVAELDGKGYDLTLSGLLQGPVPALRSSGKVSGVFTRRAYEEVVKSKLENVAKMLEYWVIQSEGKESDAAQLTEIERLRSRYFEKYIEEWKRFLQSISVAPVSGSVQALASFQDLTRGEPPPLPRLFRAVSYNTRISGISGALVKSGEGMVDQLRRKLGTTGQVAGNALQSATEREERALGAADVERTFVGFSEFGAPPEQSPVPTPGAGAPPPPRSLPIDVYQEQLAFVRDALQASIESPDSNPLAARVQSARTRVRSLLDTQEVGWRPVLESLLWPPLEMVSVASISDAADRVNKAWCSKVAQRFKDTLANRYPFRREGEDAALGDLAEFFRPNSGTVWGFYSESLRSEISRSGDGFEFARNLGGASGYRTDLLLFLQKAQEISTVLFPGGASEPSVQLSVHIRPTPRVAVVWFEVDGQRFDYRMGPEEWHRVSWPGPTKGGGALLRARTAEGQEETIQQDGEWGLMRLLELGKLKGEPGIRDFAVSWNLPSLGTSVTIDFRPVRSETPFFGLRGGGGRARLLSPFRSGFSLPLTISKGGTVCR